MPKSSEFKKSLKKFRRDLEYAINEKALRRGYDISFDVAEKFVDLAKNNLDKAQPAPESQHLIDNIKESIEVEAFAKTGRTLSRRSGENENKPKFATGAVVRIPIDKEGLVMFLEYGTGLKGLRQPHPESTDSKVEGFKVGWQYAINRNKTKTVMLRNSRNELIQTTQPCYIVRDGKRGFVFKYKSGVYIDREDVIFRNEYNTKYSWVKGYTDKNGRVVSPYVRYHKNIKTYTSKNQYVLSSGITPVRFIYDAKREIKFLYRNKKI